MPRAKKKPKHNAATRKMWAEQRKRRKGPPRKTAARAVAPPAELTEAPPPPIPKPMAAAPAAAPTADRAHAVSLGLKTLLAAVAAAGAYVVLYAAIEPIYHGTGAALRAAVPLAVEMIVGGAVFALVMGKVPLSWWMRMPLAVAGLAIIAACAKAELDAAAAAPVAAARERVTDVYQHRTKAQDVKLPDVAERSGPQAKYQHEQNQGAAIALQGKRDADARQDLKDQLANAKQEVPGESELTTLLALLGAFGSSCFLPLLEGFMRAMSRRPAEAAVPAYVPSRQIPFREPKEGFLHRLIHWPVRMFRHRQPAPA